MWKILAKSFLPFSVAAFSGIAVFYLTAPINVPAPELTESKWQLLGGSGSAVCLGRGSKTEGKSSGSIATATRIGSSAPIKILEKPQAQYTSEARKNGIEGSVRLKVVMLASGVIGLITPVTRLPDGLTQQAAEAAKRIKFKPSMVNGVPISKTVTVDYTFNVY